MRSRGPKALAVALGLAIVVTVSPVPTNAQAEPANPLVLAHYYIWFEATSWNRAKSDYPAAGRYSSEEESIMREHVELAKSVGIDGFIVSWKSTEVLDPRLELLLSIAEELDFKLVISYQSLDFNRDKLPLARIGDDLDLFVDRYADHPAFVLFEHPLIIWSGTWEFSRDDIAAVTSARADQLLILASEKSVEGYERIADAVDGNLYYWSSVNPETFPDYPTKLVEMADAVRKYNGIWIAPVAPGFDGRLLGGDTVVERLEGATLRAQWNGALASIPDAIGIISWNEFSENTHIEPSVGYGTEALIVVADLTGAPRPAAVDFDSSSPQGEPASESQIMRVVALSGLVGAIVGSALVIRRRQQERPTPSRRRAQGSTG